MKSLLIYDKSISEIIKCIGYNKTVLFFKNNFPGSIAIQ